MPTYEYACTSCGQHLEVVQSFKDDPLTTCETCGGTLRKVFSPIGVVFKGSGFYKTDSRSGRSSTAGGSGSSTASAGGTSSGDTASSSTSTPGSGDKAGAPGGASSGSGSTSSGSVAAAS